MPTKKYKISPKEKMMLSNNYKNKINYSKKDLCKNHMI